MTIKAPFNFVPLSEKVYFPEWADRISHDIPFEDQISGELEVELTARTPVYVRNGHTQEEAEKFNEICKEVFKKAEKKCGPATNDKQYAEQLKREYLSLLQEELKTKPAAAALFSRVSGRAFIPGTSFKGTVRNVLEIMSFSKIRIEDRKPFSQRDWNNEDLYPLKKDVGNIRCGFLKKSGEEGYTLYDCGKPLRIAMKRIDQYTGRGPEDKKSFYRNFSTANTSGLEEEVEYQGRTYDPKSAEYKYALLEGIKLENIWFKKDDEYSTRSRNAVLVCNDEDGEGKGTVVCTGQPGLCKWDRPKKMDPTAGKFYEFVFKESKKPRIFKLDGGQIKACREIYGDKNEWVKKGLESDKGLPVFFRMEDKRIKDWGLAYLYRLPYKNSAAGLLKENPYSSHSEKKYDLADCIFGTEEKDNALKGRVRFSHLFAAQGEDSQTMESIVLSSPKSSYYPLYIRQQSRDGKVTRYNTYNDGIISGWKRYPVRNSEKPVSLNNVDMDTVILPVGKGRVFTGKIRFHNLKEIELGALLSALTFHGHPEKYFHQLGQGKPYGYGAVEVKCRFLDPELEKRKNCLMADFEYEMKNSFLHSSWTENPAVKELFAMSYFPSGQNVGSLEYMTLGEKTSGNEFQKSIDKEECLKPYSILLSENVVPETLITAEFKVRKESEDKKKLEARMKALEEKKRLEAEIKALENRKRQEAERKALEEIKSAFERIYNDIRQFVPQNYQDKINEGEEKLQQYETELKVLDISSLPLEYGGRKNRLISDLYQFSQQLDSLGQNSCALSDLLKTINNIGTLLGRTRTWMKTNEFQDEDKNFLKQKIRDVYAGMKKSDKKKWSRLQNWGKLSDLIGEAETEEFFKELTEN